MRKFKWEIMLGMSFLFFFLTMLPEANAKQRYGTTLCDNPDYSCYVVKRKDTWKKLFPDEYDRDLVMRVNRINISLYPGLKIAIPNNIKSVSYMDVSPFPKQIDPAGKKVIKVNLDKLAWGAYDTDGNLVNWGPASGGRNYCSDVRRGCRTKMGKFAIYEKRGSGCKSTKYPVGRGGAPMPYCMFYHGGYALHGSYEVPGYNASHGCVRLFVKDAQWLNQNFSADSPVSVHVGNT